MFLWTSYFLAKKFLSKTTTKSTITYQSSDSLWSNSRNLYQLGCQVLMMTWFTNQILRLNVWVVCFWALFLGIVFRHGFFSLPLATGGCSADFTWRTEDASAFEKYELAQWSESQFWVLNMFHTLYSFQFFILERFVLKHCPFYLRVVFSIMSNVGSWEVFFSMRFTHVQSCTHVLVSDVSFREAFFSQSGFLMSSWEVTERSFVISTFASFFSERFFCWYLFWVLFSIVSTSNWRASIHFREVFMSSLKVMPGLGDLRISIWPEEAYTLSQATLRKETLTYKTNSQLSKRTPSERNALKGNSQKYTLLNAHFLNRVS